MEPVNVLPVRLGDFSSTTSHVLDNEHSDDEASNVLGCGPISTTATDCIVEIKKLRLKYLLFELCRNMDRFSSIRRG